MKSSAGIPTATLKDELYRQICEQLHDLIGEEKSLVANAANTAALLFQSLPNINWAGFYMAEKNELVLGPFQGKPACARIRFGKGVCGTAAAERRTVVVEDVSKFSGHIVCDPESRSEIAVPLLNWGRLVGVLDIDSAALKRFDNHDEEGLESVAAVFLASQPTNDLPDLSEQAANQEDTVE